MKVLLGNSAAQYNQAVAYVTDRAEPLQTALDAYTALGIATVPTVAELAELQEAPRSFLVKMMTNRVPLTLGGLPVTADKSYDLLDKPAGADDFVKMVTTLFAQNQAGSYGSNRVNVADYDLVNGQLQVKSTVLAVLLEQSRFYATTQEQVDEWNLVQTIATALNTLRQMPRFGVSFDSRQYLGKVLEREGYAAGGNAVEANLQAVLNRA